MDKVFKSFKDLGAAMGIKTHKNKPEETRKCEKCGGQLHRILDTNVWVCDFCKLEEQETASGELVQVFYPCENVLIS